jgi:hypothetical protein
MGLAMKNAVLLVLVLGLALSGCSPGTIQTTSGRTYLDSYTGLPSADNKGSRQPISGRTVSDQAVRDAANIEPILRFPARFGLARISHGSLSAVPPEEGDIWQTALVAGGGGYGEFVPISPLVAAFAAGGQQIDYSVNRVVDTIRLGAARQHVEAVLVYEVISTAKDTPSVMSALDLTIIGAYLLPTRTVSGSAVAQAVLLDVRNGYPYLTVEGSASTEEMHASVGSFVASREQQGVASVAAVKNMVAKIPALLDQLRGRLGDKPDRRKAN